MISLTDKSMLSTENATTPIKLKGVTTWVTKDASGKILDKVSYNNNILLQIRKPIIKLLGAAQTEKASMPFVYSIGFGTDGTAATETQTGLLAPVDGANKLLAAAPQFDSDGLGVTFVVLFDLTDEYVDGVTLREAVLFTQPNATDTHGIAIARVAVGEYTKKTGTYLEYYHKIRTEVSSS